MTNWRHLFSLREKGVYYALLLLVLILSLMTTYLGRSNYLSLLNVTNVLYQASLIGIMAVAMTVILISGNFDLSVASVAALSAAVFVGNADAIGFWPAFVAAMTVAVAAGLLNGAIVQFVGINAFIVTLGTMTALRGVVLLYTNGYALSVENADVIAAMQAFESGRMNVGSAILTLGIVLLAAGLLKIVQAQRQSTALRPSAAGVTMLGLCLLVLSWMTNVQLALPKPVIYLFSFTAIVWFALTYTMIGRRLYAVGGNPEAARLSGINVPRYKIQAFVLCSAAAGFSGILFASRLRSINPGGLSGAELTVIAVAILGGTSLFGGAGSVIKTLAGALLLFSLSNGFNILNLGANYQGLIEGIVVVAAAAVYTAGGKHRGKVLGAKTG
ncbi:ABC transporter permease [Rhizobium sp. Leaf386]|nr:ABC transporter permease [Rhizobium sp. Leaf386]